MKQEKGTHSQYVVKHRVSIPGLHNIEQLRLLVRELLQLNGVVEVVGIIRRHQLRISYEPNRINFDKIEQTLTALDFPPSLHWWMRLKANWYRFTDDNARANAEAKGGSCCSQPTDIYAQRHRRG